MSENDNQLPVKVRSEIISNAQEYTKSYIYNNDWVDTAHCSYIEGATAYASKLHQANETIKVLEYENNKLKGEVEGYKSAVEELKGTGAVWVKCWEQKPDTHKVRFKDKHGNEFIGNYSKDTGQYWAYGLGQAINDVIYWRPQDESAAGREDAVEFAEWAGWDWRRIEGKNMWENQKTLDVISTSKLYEKYKEETR